MRRDTARKAPRLFFLTGVVLVVAALWPVVRLLNRIYPLILGLPLFVVYMLLLNFAVAAFLCIAYFVLE